MDLPDSQSCAHQRDHNKAGNQNEPGRTFHEMWSGPCVGVVRSSGFKLEVTICALHYPCFLGPTILVDPTLLPGSVPPASNLDMREPMPHPNSSIVRLACLALVIGVSGCGSDLVLPSAPPGQESLA